jgi:hypothetical protein
VRFTIGELLAVLGHFNALPVCASEGRKELLSHSQQTLALRLFARSDVSFRVGALLALPIHPANYP